MCDGDRAVLDDGLVLRGHRGRRRRIAAAVDPHGESTLGYPRRNVEVDVEGGAADLRELAHLDGVSNGDNSYSVPLAVMDDGGDVALVR